MSSFLINIFQINIIWNYIIQRKYYFMIIKYHDCTVINSQQYISNTINVLIIFLNVSFIILIETYKFKKTSIQIINYGLNNVQNINTPWLDLNLFKSLLLRKRNTFGYSKQWINSWLHTILNCKQSPLISIYE